MAGPILLAETRDGVATIRLNRPDVHNAFDDALIAELTGALRAVAAESDVRAVVLAAAGKSFSAGADLNWMRRMAGASIVENEADARALADLMRTLRDLAKPTVAVVQGPAYGGGVGLVAACDIAIAADSATFALSEVRLGLIPAVVSPYVIAAIGARAARRYFLTGERFGAAEALRLGLVHSVVPADQLEQTLGEVVAALREGGPLAQAAAKRLVADVAGRPIDAALAAETARRIAEIRAGAEGKEGVGAFLDKREPAWRR
ncbi:MAG: enoyl-CoA hydratase-related protein [Dongiaceae bacterium]